MASNDTEIVLRTNLDVIPSEWQTSNIQIRPHGHDCYYATLAGLKQTTIDALIDLTKIPDKETGATIDEITNLYTAAGYPGQLITFQSKDKVKEYVCSSLKLFPELGLRLAIGYKDDSANIGHVVAIIAYMIRNGSNENEEPQPTYHVTDFQKDTNNRFKKSSLPNVNYYWIWETKERYYRKQTQNK